MEKITYKHYQKVIDNIANNSYKYHSHQATNGNKQAVSNLVNRVLEMHQYDASQLDLVIKARYHLLHKSLKNVVSESERDHVVDAIKELSNYIKQFKTSLN